MRGTSYRSDIAIDDVSLIENCTATPEISTTTIDILYTDSGMPTESCLNRCDSDNDLQRHLNNFILSCGCDESCVDSNSCCPDYAALCILGPDDFGTTDAITEPDAVPVTTTATRHVTTVEPNEFAKFSKTASPSTGHPIVFVVPDTTEAIYEKVITTPRSTGAVFEQNATIKYVPVPTTHNTVISVTTNATEAPKPVFVKNKTMATKAIFSTTTKSTTAEKYKTEWMDNDALTIPVVAKKEDEDFEIVLTAPPNETLKSVPSLKLVDSSYGYITTVVVVIVSIVLVGIAGWQRYRMRTCGLINRLKSGCKGSDSLSDVRFLTGDEILDFNLAHQDDYDI